eukprot:TRINITY_DN7950_c0_g1_i1.p1 TRINITY_DN7950_c0_g1~~TRINITY_DN7950_c0_g1_i1.p1  ORF type:complete len:392 (+),score=69.18 TRINITY_DN7950_c0_g1_i1:353-1528(+)
MRFFEYFGDWHENKKHGIGILAMKNGTQYEGDFKNGEMTGNGIKRWPDGGSYKGTFTDGEPNGDGEFSSPSGENYVGVWSFGLKHGFGKQSVAGQYLYEGDFEFNTFHGKGKLTTAAGFTWTGNFIKGKLCGQGTISTPNKLYFEGNLENGLRNGEGCLTYDQTILSAAWIADDLSQEIDVGSAIKFIFSGDSQISESSPTSISISNVKQKITIIFDEEVGRRSISAKLFKGAARSSSRASLDAPPKADAASKLPRVMFSSAAEWEQHSVRKSVKKKSIAGGIDDREPSAETPDTITSEFVESGDGIEGIPDGVANSTVISFYLPPTATRGVYILSLCDDTAWPEPNVAPCSRIPDHSAYDGPVHRNFTFPTTIPEKVGGMPSSTLAVEVK